jgi:hypothetical protein
VGHATQLTAGIYCSWKPQVSITLKGELGGPNSMAGRDIVAADPAAEEEEEEEEEEADPAPAEEGAGEEEEEEEGMLLLCQALCAVCCM